MLSRPSSSVHTKKRPGLAAPMIVDMHLEGGATIGRSWQFAVSHWRLAKDSARLHVTPKNLSSLRTQFVDIKITSP